MIRQLTDNEYDEYVRRIQERFTSNIKDRTIFKTDAANLWSRCFLANIDGRFRQQYNCIECREFIKSYGSLVVLDPEIKGFKSAIWNEDDTPMIFKESVRSMIEAIDKSFIQGIFFSSNRRLGCSQCGGLSHLSLMLPEDHVSCTDTPKIMTYEKLKDKIYLMKAIKKIDVDLFMEIDPPDNNLTDRQKWFNDIIRVYSEKDISKCQWNSFIWCKVSNYPHDFCRICDTNDWSFYKQFVE